MENTDKQTKAHLQGDKTAFGELARRSGDSVISIYIERIGK